MAPRVNYGDGQEVVFQDLNDMAQVAESEVLDRIGFHLGAEQENFCFGGGFKVSYDSATSVEVAAGVGAQTDNTVTGSEPKKRMLYRDAPETLVLDAADGANPRIDIVCIKHARAVSASQNRVYKPLVGSTTTLSFDVKTDWESELLVVTGTPAGSPSAPATPAGYLKIAELAIAAGTGLPSTGGITDTRNVFLRGSSRSAIATKTADYVATLEDETLLVDATAGDVDITLPPAASSQGKILRVKKMDGSANVVNIIGTIDGATDDVLDQQYAALTMLSIGSEWSILS
jgi:hypothetical protein